MRVEENKEFGFTRITYDKSSVLDLANLLLLNKLSISKTFDVAASYGGSAALFNFARSNPSECVNLIERIQECIEAGAADGEAVWGIFTEQKDGALEVVEHTPTMVAPKP